MDSKTEAQQSPVGSPGKNKASNSPIQRTPSPTTDDLLPGNHWAEAPDDDEGLDLTSNDNASSTASLSASILDYRTVQGRTYHSDRGNAEYWGSNDERQNEAMDIAHHVHTLTLSGKLFLAPLDEDKIQKVVDIGTGTGVWAVDFGDQYPNCEVIGTDISPIQETWVPPNVRFELDDCTQPWTFDPDSFDFVHMRYLTGSLQDWMELFKQAFTCTKPGGYVESFEASPFFRSDDETVTDTSALSQWGKLFVEGGKRIGRQFTMVDEGTQRKAMEEAGYVEIEEKDFKVPMGRWPKDPQLKELGGYAYAAIASDIEGYVLYMANMQGWTKEEVTVYAAHLRNEIRNPNIHGYYLVKVVWGKKPE